MIMDPTKAVLALGLTKLPPHLPVFGAAFGLFTVVHQVLAPAVSEWLCPQTYGKMNKRAKNTWCMHVVSQVMALIVVPLAFKCLQIEALDADRAFGWDEGSGALSAIAAAYFLWDTLDAVLNFLTPGFIVHGIACLSIYMMSFRPFLAYYASRCLLWEITIFLNIHWFLDKTNRTGGKFQLINGIVLLFAFFGVRIVYGGLVSYRFFHTLYDVRNEIPAAYIVVYGGGNIVLQALNYIWFSKMIGALRKRFAAPPSTNGSTNGHTNGTGNGHAKA